MSAVSRASRTKKLFTPLHILLSSFALSHLSLSFLSPVSCKPHICLHPLPFPSFPSPFFFSPPLTFVLASSRRPGRVRMQSQFIDSLVTSSDTEHLSSLCFSCCCRSCCAWSTSCMCLEDGGRRRGMHEGGGSSWWRYTMSSELRESERVRERERERESTTEDASLADGVEGGQWSITNRIHLSAWLIFPIKTAQQEPQQSTSWNRGYFSACLSAGCVCVCVCHWHLFFWHVSLRFGEA